jgi:flagellar biosynthesis GTPase FlhF
MGASRFLGATLLEAVQRAKQALGPDALVIAARRISGGGLLRRRHASVFEVTVLDAQAAAAPSFDPLWSPGARADALAVSLAETRRLSEELTELRRAVEALERSADAAGDGPDAERSRVARVRIAPNGAPAARIRGA